MRVDVPSSEVMRHTFWLGGGPEAPGLRQLADCVARVRPAIAAAGRCDDDRSLVAALTAITVHLALEAGDARLAAALFRSSARLLDLARDAGPTA